MDQNGMKGQIPKLLSNYLPNWASNQNMIYTVCNRNIGSFGKE